MGRVQQGRLSDVQRPGPKGNFDRALIRVLMDLLGAVKSLKLVSVGLDTTGRHRGAQATLAICPISLLQVRLRLEQNGFSIAAVFLSIESGLQRELLPYDAIHHNFTIV